MPEVYNRPFGIAINRTNGREQGVIENSPLLPPAAHSLRQTDHITEDNMHINSLCYRSRSMHDFSLQRPGFIPRHLSQAWRAILAFLLGSYLNCLFFLVPLGIIAGMFSRHPNTVFTINLLAIIPLANTASFATTEISLNLNDTLGGLFQAISGNVIELIICITALQDNQIAVVQSAILGSVLSNLLLVKGMCFFLGGIFNMRDRDGQGKEQIFASATSQTTRSLMTLSSASLILPATFYLVFDKAEAKEKEHAILHLSRGTAIVLLSLYLQYLWFQLNTHTNLFSTEIQYDEEEVQGSVFNLPAAIFLFIVTSGLVTLCAGFIVTNIEHVVSTTRFNYVLVGTFLIPVANNSAEYIVAVRMAVKNKMDLAIGIAIGSSIQAVLFVKPLLVILGWAVLDKPMTLHFETDEVAVFMFTVLVTYAIQDGRSNYLQGSMLPGFYSIILLIYLVSPIDAMDKV
ncbi:Vacuolar calcium ion transporter 2 [Colletotrichum musicola]|uniref:Vacuolar calcium ion transporter n=1 Tax=Colletotrichum musicola TaxID=2175873 RepID=A0A8H6K825_9PEZI|nr:Vacuolar calcium ion transporter 2 [Colletotrichum musicola]